MVNNLYIGKKFNSMAVLRMLREAGYYPTTALLKKIDTNDISSLVCIMDKEEFKYFRVLNTGDDRCYVYAMAIPYQFHIDVVDSLILV